MDTSEYQLHLHKKLIDDKKVADSTATAYIKTLVILNGKKPFKNLTFLKKTDDIDKIIEHYAENTKRAMYASVVSVLSLYKDKTGFKKPFLFYSEKIKRKDEPPADTTVKTERQKDQNWISWSEIQKIKDELSIKPTSKTIDGTEYEKLLKYMILSFFTDIPPRRNKDYLEMYIVKKWNNEMPTDKNYLDVSTRKMSFCAYKTSKKYGTQTLDIPDSLWIVIQSYLKYHPLWKVVANRKDPVKLLVNYDGSPISAVNSITRILNTVFGRKMGSSALRHIYLSDKYGDDLKERQKDSEAMGHSLNIQKEYIKLEEPKEKKTE